LTAGEKLEQARRAAAELGLLLDDLDRLAVSLRAAARLLSVSHGQVEKLVARGELGAFRVGRSVRIDLVELVAFVDRNRQAPSGVAARSPRARAIELIDEAE
jgi:excisionase family DNA binding protein